MCELAELSGDAAALRSALDDSKVARTLPQGVRGVSLSPAEVPLCNMQDRVLRKVHAIVAEIFFLPMSILPGCHRLHYTHTNPHMPIEPCRLSAAARANELF